MHRRANTDIRIVRDLVDIRAHEHVHPKIPIRVLIPLYPPLAHSRAVRELDVRIRICTNVFFVL